MQNDQYRLHMFWFPQGLLFIEDIIKAAPILLWHSICTKIKVALNKDIVIDCLSLDHSPDTPWLSYIREAYLSLKIPFIPAEGWYNFDCSTVELKARLREEEKAARDQHNLLRRSVVSYLSISPACDMQPYLSDILSTHHMFMLTRFRLNIVHLMVAYRLRGQCNRERRVCPCDGKPVQCTIHFVFFCTFYHSIRGRFRRPRGILTTTGDNYR